MGHLRSRLLTSTVLALGLALGLITSVALAQAPTPTSTVALTPPPTSIETHPAAVHKGTCQQPTEAPDYSLGNVRTFSNEKLTPVPLEGTAKAPPVLSTTDTKVNVKLSDLLTPQQPYVIVVHESQQQFTTYLACGEIGGPVLNNQLVVPLRPLKNSGYAGLAFLKGNGSTLTSNVYLFSQVQALSGQIATPPAGPTPTPGPTIPPTPSPTPTQTPTPSPTPARTPTPAKVPVTPTPAAGVVRVTPTPTATG